MFTKRAQKCVAYIGIDNIERSSRQQVYRPTAQPSQIHVQNDAGFCGTILCFITKMLAYLLRGKERCY